MLPKLKIDTGQYCAGINNPPLFAVLKFLPKLKMSELMEDRFPDLSISKSLDDDLCLLRIES